MFKNNNSAATTVIRSDKARTRGVSYMEMCTEDEDSWEQETSSALTVVRNGLARTT